MAEICQHQRWLSPEMSRRRVLPYAPYLVLESPDTVPERLKEEGGSSGLGAHERAQCQGPWLLPLLREPPSSLLAPHLPHLGAILRPPLAGHPMAPEVFFRLHLECLRKKGFRPFGHHNQQIILVIYVWLSSYTECVLSSNRTLNPFPPPSPRGALEQDPYLASKYI